MKQITFFIFALFLFPFSNSWAQDTDEAVIPGDSLMVNMGDYGLLYEDELEENGNLSQMPIYDFQLFEDKGFIWSPSDKWLYNMPVIKPFKQDSSHQKNDKKIY